MGSSLGTGYPRNLQGLHEIGTRQAIGLIFSPQRGEQYPLMWGFIPHARGEFSQRNIRGLDFFNWEIKTTILIISKTVSKPFNPNRSLGLAWILFFRRVDFVWLLMSNSGLLLIKNEQKSPYKKQKTASSCKKNTLNGLMTDLGLTQIGHHGQPGLCFFSEERILSPNGIMTVWGVMLSCDTATVLFLPPA